jgi:hypothetical protein
MIHITEKKLVAAIQIALVGECENIDRVESKLLHDIKALSIAIVSGSYYWVKCFTDDKYEPTVAVDHYNNGTMYFKFLNGLVIECKRVADYKGLRI